MMSLSTGIVAETMTALSGARRLGCYNIKQLAEAGLTSGVKFGTAIEFARDNDWIKKAGDEFALTPVGEHIIEDFNGYSISTDVWRDILSVYVNQCAPTWTSRIPAGRKEAYLFMQPDEQRCFSEAGLMDDPPDPSVVDWWMEAASDVRSRQDAVREETGRYGEGMTLTYEEERVGMRPKWEAFETNCAGYDILSCVARNDLRKRLIEVKTSEDDIDYASMIISRNEWDVAIHTPPNIEYRFYLWSVRDRDMLAILTPEDVAPHISTDGGAGTWTSVKIPFDAFRKKFIEVPHNNVRNEPAGRLCM